MLLTPLPGRWEEEVRIARVHHECIAQMFLKLEVTIYLKDRKEISDKAETEGD